MNKLILLKSFAAAAAAALLTSACVSTEPASQDESVFVIADDSTLTQFIVDNKPMDTEIQPGKIYVSSDLSEAFVCKNISNTLNEEGLLMGQVTGEMKEYSFWKWMFSGEEPYSLVYRFVWFDENGSMAEPQMPALSRRETLPGDPVRFTSIAPNEDCPNFTLFLTYAPASVSEEDSPAEAAE